MFVLFLECIFELYILSLQFFQLLLPQLPRLLVVRKQLLGHRIVFLTGLLLNACLF